MRLPLFFVFGLVVGSFFNVIALRYDGENFLFNPKVIGGRSRCPHCHTTLRWFELVPLVSFIIQGGKCRHCKAFIGFRYPVVELLSGLIFLFVPLQRLFFFPNFPTISVLWVFAFEIFLLIGYIDILLGIIPDELNILLFAVGLLETYKLAISGASNVSFLGLPAAFFGLQTNVWTNHFAAALFGAAFFGLLVIVTKGKGMGLGDVKLAFPLGFLFGWPDILILLMMTFVIGGVFGIFAVTGGSKTLKSQVPFAPFLMMGATVVFFFGATLFQAYFHVIGL